MKQKWQGRGEKSAVTITFAERGKPNTQHFKEN